MILRPFSTMVFVVCAILAPTTAPAEIFKLATGGQVQGQLLNPDESPRKQYRLETASGIQLTLDPAQVVEVVHQLPAEIEYDKIRAGYPDTVDGQWRLAQWCRDHHLPDQRAVHLQRIIELEPDHAEARRALGYSRYEGRWLTRDQVMTSRGWVRYQGQWMLPQRKQILVNRHELDVARKAWLQKLRRYCDWLDGSKAPQAAEAIRAIDDPMALSALHELLTGKNSISTPPHRLLLMEAVARINTPAAHATLVRCSLDDPTEEVRLTALDHLSGVDEPEVLKLYTAALQSEDNEIVNRAAASLEALNNAAAIPALIEALVTRHKSVYSDGSQPGQTTSTFGNGPGGGGSSFTAGGGPKLIIRDVRNTAVLDALVGLTGVNFDYDEQAWKGWYVKNKPQTNINTRRD
ncbi:MAG: HEAT repeat domain-containing protein [Pirellulales bacterium]|nr:HEAT repeat domain-containing protein [Pirellulales bacterium]